MRRHAIVANQLCYNLIDRAITNNLLPYCQAHGITVIAYSPLARGVQRILDCDQGGVIARLAEATQHSPVQIALNWCVSQAGVVAIPKGSSEEHVRENCGASDWRLTPTQVAELDRSIAVRRRSPVETFLRRHLPPGYRAAIRRLMERAPRPLRRRFL